MTRPSPNDANSTRYPVSIKGVLIHENKVLLLKNERNEWELPGGKLELGETPEDCLAREIEEETGFDGIRLSHEHKEIDVFDVNLLDGINLPIGYKNTINAALALD